MKTLIFSEIGVNHNGDMEKIEKMIHSCADIGVDGVKLQYFRVNDLDVDKRLKRILEPCQLTIDQICEVKRITESRKLLFLCTAMVRFELVEELVGIGLKWLKIREKDSYDYEFIKKCLPLLERVYISTTKRPVDDMFLFYHPKIRWVYTVPKYPASFSDLDLKSMRTYDGYSNHVPNITSPLTSCIIAKIYEKKEWYLEIHFTLNHKLGDIDDNVSLDVNELKQLVDLVRQIE